MKTEIKQGAKNVLSDCLLTQTGRNKTLSFRCRIKDTKNQIYMVSLELKGPKDASPVNGLKIFGIVTRELQDWLSKLGMET